MTDFVDFDAAWAERSTDAPSFKAFGRTFTLPTQPPVKLMLMAVREAEGVDGKVDAKLGPDKVLDLAAMLIGRQTVKTLLEEGVTFDQLSDVIRYAQQSYAKRKGDDPDPPTAGTAEQPAPSSPTGDTSKPTSNASTDWIS